MDADMPNIDPVLAEPLAIERRMPARVLDGVPHPLVDEGVELAAIEGLDRTIVVPLRFHV